MNRVVLVAVVGDRPRLFSSIETAERTLEPTDVRAGIQAFDRDGRVYRVQVHDDGWGREIIRLQPDPQQQPRPADLRGHLERLLTGFGQTIRRSDTLADLLRRAEPHCRT